MRHQIPAIFQLFLAVFWLAPGALIAQGEKSAPQEAPTDDDSAAGDDDSAAPVIDWTAKPANEAVQLHTEAENTKAGSVVDFVVTNERGESIFILGCRPLQPEMFGEERWETVPGERCPGEGIAQEVPTGELKLQLSATGQRHMLFRATLTYGVGCTVGVPLSAAKCRDFATVASPKIRVTPPDDE